MFRSDGWLCHMNTDHTIPKGITSFVVTFLSPSTIMIAQQPIPVYTTLAEVFGGAELSLPHAKRWNNLAEQFKDKFGRKPVYIARAPGRVK